MPPQVVTFGCRMNMYESEHIRHALETAGVNDVIVVNTCAVTAETERQVRQLIRKKHREAPSTRIIVMGCAGVVNRETYSSMPQVFAVVKSIRELLQVLGCEQSPHCLLMPHERDHGALTQPHLTAPPHPQPSHQQPHLTAPPHPPQPSELPVLNGLDAIGLTNMSAEQSPAFIPHFHERTRAFLAIQTGCNHHCSFCITRIARGKSVSFPVSQILEQAKIFANTAGINELTITGINISSFKYDDYTLGKLILLLLDKLPDRVRLRISSLDPADVDDAIFVALENPRVLPHMHFSIQSGSDAVLRRMMRRHTSKMAEMLIEKVRKIRDGITIGGDFICGFPTETSEMFQQTLDFVVQNNVTLPHVFPYSDRPGTQAAGMVPKVLDGIKKERAANLRALGRELLLKRLHELVGQEVSFLAEKRTKTGFSGKTDYFFEVQADWEAAQQADWEAVQQADRDAKDTSNLPNSDSSTHSAARIDPYIGRVLHTRIHGVDEHKLVLRN